MRKSAHRRPYQPRRLKLATMPWKVDMVFGLIERILHRLEADCTIDSAQGRPVFHEDGKGGWYDVVEALRGVIAFHQLAEARHGIDTCKRQAMRLLLDEATDIVQTIRIGMELDKLKPAPAANSERTKQADGKTAPGAGTQ